MLILICIVYVVPSSILALISEWKLGLVGVFGALPPVVLCGYLHIRLEFKLEADTRERFASSASLAAEAVSTIRTATSLALEICVLGRYRERPRGVIQRSMKATVWTIFCIS